MYFIEATNQNKMRIQLKILTAVVNTNIFA